MPAAIPHETDIPVTERLYLKFQPRHYDLELLIDPDRDGFSGKVSIELDLPRPSRIISLHVIGISISKAVVNGTRLETSKIQLNPAEETVVLDLGSELPAGPAKVELVYSASFDRQMRGLYLARARYKEKEEHQAFTQFEPTDARRMLPCIDEPEAKATFNVTVMAPERWTVLSNSVVLRRQVSSGNQTVEFKKTPEMSTYLLAIAVARLVSRSAKAGKTKITAWAMPHQIGQCAFALKTAHFVLDWLNRYFNLPYPLEKLDLVVVPEFDAGAMENWGLITFCDAGILVDPKLTSAHSYRYIAQLVAHEIVHQWFGNLVTMKWWNDLWLNESFATWLAYKAVDAWKPAWRIWRDYEESKTVALPIDALKNTRPISSPVRTTADIIAQFDRLTYEKGGAVLRMIESYLGEDAFRAGVRAYMCHHQYGNTEARDLWKALEGASHEPIVNLANDWLHRPGFPLIRTSRVAGKDRAIKLSQSRFSAYSAADRERPWIMPVILKYQLADEKKPRVQRVLLKERETIVDLSGKGKLSWIYPNAGETGFYRVAFDEELLNALIRHVQSALDSVERSSLLSHMYALAKNGDLELRHFIGVLRAFKGELDWFVLRGLAGALIDLHDRVAKTSSEKLSIRAIGLEIAGPAVKKFGWGTLKAEDKKLARAAALKILTHLSPDSTIIKKVEQSLKKYLKLPVSLDSALAAVVLIVGARIGDEKRYNEYVRMLHNASTPEQKDDLLVALSAFRNPEVLEQALNLMLSDRILGQDMWITISRALRDPEVQVQAWEFARAHWPEIHRKAGEMGTRRIIEGLSGYWSPNAKREAEEFFSIPSNHVPSAERSLRQTLEFMELGATFRERTKNQLSSALSL